MAEKREQVGLGLGEAEFTITLKLLDKAYVKQALFAFGKALTRSRAKEMPGSDIANLRDKDIERVAQLWARF